jgi:hypothetical protein
MPPGWPRRHHCCRSSWINLVPDLERGSGPTATVLALDMADVERSLDPRFMVDKALDGLLKERPVWQSLLLGLRGSMHGQETLEELTSRLAEAESRSPELAPSPAPPRAHASAPAPSAIDVRLTSMEAQLQEITLELRKRSTPLPRPPREQRSAYQGRYCYCCGSE